MQCQQVEKLLLDQAEALQAPEVTSAVQAHLATCPDCRQFAAQLQVLRGAIPTLKKPTASASLIERTLERCHQEMAQLRVKPSSIKVQPHFLPLPKPVIITLILLMALSVSWVIGVITHTIKNQQIDQHTLWVLFFFIQNIMMLLLAPLLINRFRKQFIQNIVF